tara:strand:- start:1033 stop:1374 length:342 start_codon:yes stop_codon:yes gene_type:complete
MEKILENIWVLFIGIGSWAANRLAQKIDALEKDKASGDDINGIRKGVADLDRRVDSIDHSTQLRLVPRSEYKSDIGLLHTRLNDLSERLCEKEDRIKTIRVNEPISEPTKKSK